MHENASTRAHKWPVCVSECMFVCVERREIARKMSMRNACMWIRSCTVPLSSRGYVATDGRRRWRRQRQPLFRFVSRASGAHRFRDILHVLSVWHPLFGCDSFAFSILILARAFSRVPLRTHAVLVFIFSESAKCVVCLCASCVCVSLCVVPVCAFGDSFSLRSCCAHGQRVL